MTFPAHGLLTTLPLFEAGVPIEFCILNFIRGALPDLIAMPETAKGNWQNLYLKTHFFWKLMWWVSPDHLAIDRLTHKDEGGWNNLGYLFEGIFWGFVTDRYGLKIICEVYDALLKIF